MDFRGLISLLDRQGVIRNIEQPISSEWLPWQVYKEEQAENKAVRLNLSGCSFTVAANVYGSDDRVCRALDTNTNGELVARINRSSAEAKPLNMIGAPQADYKILSKPDLSLFLPQVRHSRFDQTPYLTSGVAIARHPESGHHHCSFIRCSIQSGNRMLFNPHTPRIKAIAQSFIEKGKDWPVVMVIGPPPAVTLMGAAGLPDRIDDLSNAQGLDPDIRFFDQGLPVPDGSELILCGNVLTDMAPEGPVGDYKGTYSARLNPIFEVDRLWVRKKTVYHFLRGGVSAEHMTLLSLKAKLRLESLDKKSLGIIDYHLPIHTGGRLCLVRMMDGFPREKLVEALLGVPLVRIFVLVGHDVTLTDSKDILWSIVQRSDKGADFIFPPDPSRVFPPTKMIIDALPADPRAWEHRRIDVYTPESNEY